jgi:hypothetical protein
MAEAQVIAQKGTAAVKKLRVSKLKQGSPFMINVKSLPASQCYLEFPNGKITLATYSSKNREFVIVRELSGKESADLRMQLGLELIPA